MRLHSAVISELDGVGDPEFDRLTVTGYAHELTCKGRREMHLPLGRVAADEGEIAVLVTEAGHRRAETLEHAREGLGPVEVADGAVVDVVRREVTVDVAISATVNSPSKVK